MKTIRNPHFWAVLVASAACTILHYPQQLPFVSELGLSSLLGLERHAIERILFLLPIMYAGFAFGFRGGVAAALLAAAVMLPRVFFVSRYPSDAFLETVSIISAGVAANWWLESHRREIGLREQSLLKLSSARRQLQTYVDDARMNQQMLAAVHSVSAAINRTLALEDVLDVACSGIQDAMNVDATVVFMLNESTRKLEVKAYKGISSGFASAIDGLDFGEGFNGSVVKTGNPEFVEDALSDPRLTRAAVRENNIRSLFIVPLKTKERIVGTLCVAKHTKHVFSESERELLSLIGSELGTAAEKAFLFRQLREYAGRISEAHEEERRRIARDIHDDTIQIMVAISRKLDMASSSARGDGITQEIEVIQKDVDDALVRMRRFVQDLRPPTLECLGLLPALRELAGQIPGDSPLVVEMEATGDERTFSEKNNMLVYRIVQEALRNVVKHSGASKCRIGVSYGSQETIITVQDNGRGFMAEGMLLGNNAGLGIVGMKERSLLLGAAMKIDSHEGAGTKITLRIPTA